MIDSKRKAFIFLTLAFLLAVFAASLFVSEVRKAQEALGETVQVAVANVDIATYTEITEDMVRWVDIPRNEHLESSFIRHSNDFLDSISIVYVREGEIVTKNMMRSKVDLPEDHRIVWLNASDNVLIDQQVGEGDIVDIIISYEQESNRITKRLFTDIAVVSSERGEEGSVVKVSVPIEDAENLIHYQNHARQIRVLLVNQVARGENLDSQADDGQEEGELEDDSQTEVENEEVTPENNQTQNEQGSPSIEGEEEEEQPSNEG
ncbi:Flp pilus assembly protein CpaB [Bacillus horti]|uniref:Flp pilus assembly protein CpaB n=1 Tax=Caldalkalibacillus horti TaxID=77523 RepID=A0ABT9VX73_9BACI|nr:SAF domain-containing protein [Bacillus horti]MDQ0165210.1 Flp pilus assembly protein CpaB [Bacillus horti]